MRSTTARFFSAMSLVVMMFPNSSSGPTALDPEPYSRFLLRRSRSPPSPGSDSNGSHVTMPRVDLALLQRLIEVGAAALDVDGLESSLYGMPFSTSVAANWNQTAEPGAMAIFLPLIPSSQLSSFTPLRPMTYFGELPTPISPPMTLVEPCDSAIARSAGPNGPATSSEPARRAVRASA